MDFATVWASVGALRLSVAVLFGPLFGLRAGSELSLLATSFDFFVAHGLS